MAFTNLMLSVYRYDFVKVVYMYYVALSTPFVYNATCM